jgi:hypothetical protein
VGGVPEAVAWVGSGGAADRVGSAVGGLWLGRCMESSDPSTEPSEPREPTAYGVLDLVRRAVEVCSVPTGERSAGEWMDLVAEVTQAMTVLAAARDAAVVRLAAVDESVDEDGVIRERVNGLGTVSLDAGAMVATATGTSTRFGGELVDQAVTRVVRVPALHEAMAEGALDDYKSRCVAVELSDVPPELARTVVEALGEELALKSGPALRRRTREVLFRLSPDLLRERLRRARTAVGLRRWVGEPGTDSWGGSFPSERAATAWAAIDELARRYRAEGRHDTLEQARAYALMDLVDGRATVETVLHLSVPATSMAEAAAVVEAGAGAEDGAVAVARPPGGTETSAGGLDISSAFVATAGVQGRSVHWLPMRWLLDRSSRAVGRLGAVRSCHPITGAFLDPGDHLTTQGYRPGQALATLVRQRDAGCRFPGCSVPARQCDLDHVVPWPHGPTVATNLLSLCRRHHRLKQRHRWRVRLRPDGVAEWTDPTGRRHLSDPVDHLGATQRMVVDRVGLFDGGAMLDRVGVFDGSAMLDRVGVLDGLAVLDRVGVLDGSLAPEAPETCGDGPDATATHIPARIVEPPRRREDLESSQGECRVAVVVEHAVALARAEAGSASEERKRAGKPFSVMSVGELDDLSRQVRGGPLGDLDSAIAARAAKARGSEGTGGCRVDHGVPRASVCVSRRLLSRHHAGGRDREEPPPF